MSRRHRTSVPGMALIAALSATLLTGCRPGGPSAAQIQGDATTLAPGSPRISEVSTDHTVPTTSSVKPATGAVLPLTRQPTVAGVAIPFTGIGAGHFNGTREPLIPGLPERVVMGLSPQQRFLLTGRNSGENGFVIEVWNLKTKKMVLERQEPAGIEAIQFHPQGRSFTCDVGKASDSTTWMELGPAAVTRRQTAADSAAVLAFSPDGRRLAAAGPNHNVEVRDVTGPKPLQVLSGHQHPVQAASFSPDGRTLITGDAAGELVRWDLATGEKLMTCSFARTLLAAPVPAEAPDPVLSDTEGLETSSATSVSPSTASPVTASGLTVIAFSPDQSVVAVGTANGYSQTFDLRSGTALSPVFHQSLVTDIVFAPDAASIIVVTQSGKVSRWWRAPAAPLLLTQQPGSARFAALDATGRRAVTGGIDRQLRVWDVDRRSLVHSLDTGGEAITAGALSSDGRRAATASYGSGIVLWDLDGMKSLGKRYGHQKRVWAFDFAPDNETLASASDDQTVRIWKSGSPKTIRTITLDAAVRFVRFSPDGTQLATATLDPGGWQFPARLQLWNTQTGKPLTEFRGHQMAVNSAVFSPDGKELTSCDAKGVICRWNVATGERLGSHHHPIGLAHAGLIAPRGLIVIRRYPNGVLISRAGELTPVSAFDLPARAIGDLNVAAQGDRIIAGTEDGAVYVWSLGHD